MIAQRFLLVVPVALSTANVAPAEQAVIFPEELSLVQLQAQPQADSEAAPARSFALTDEPRAGHAALRAGLGFTSSPGTFLMAVEGDFFLTQNLSLGPLLQVGVSDDPVIVAPTLNFQWIFDLPAGAQRFRPFAQWGLGAAYLHDDRRNHDDDDVGFLANLGFGFEVTVTDLLAMGSNMLFNFLPDKVLDEHFFFSWQVVTVTFSF